MLEELGQAPFDPARGPPGALFHDRFANSWLRMVYLVLRRQIMLNKRSGVYYVARIGQV